MKKIIALQIFIVCFSISAFSNTCKIGLNGPADVSTLGAIDSHISIILSDIEAINSSTPRPLDNIKTCTRIGIIQGMFEASSFGYGTVRRGTPDRVAEAAQSIYNNQFESYCAEAQNANTLRKLRSDLQELKIDSSTLLSYCNIEKAN